MTRPHTLTTQHHRAVQSGAYDGLTGGDGVLLAAGFEMDHRLIPRKKSSGGNVSPEV
jgi:hypothetical protein